MIVSPMPFISDYSLAQLKTFGGKVVLVGAEQSFLKTEMGAARSNVWNSEAFALLPMTGSIELVPELKRILSPIAPPPLVYVDVAGPGGRAALGVAINEAADPVSGNVVLVLNNFSNEPRVVTVEEGMKVADLIGHRKEENRLVLAPCDVRLLMLAKWRMFFAA